jgi:hypothetical protein
MYRLNQNQDVIELLLKLNQEIQDYPAHLFEARRIAFLKLLSTYSRYVGSLVMGPPLTE